jgi:hypothetical protein
MTSQAPASNLTNFLDVGNAIVYYSKTPKVSFAAAEAATDYRKLGMLSNVSLEVAREVIKIRSGFPQRTVKQFFSAEDVRLNGEMLEISPFNINRALGGPTMTITTLTSSPAATTVASGSTKSIVNVASAAGYAPNDIIEVGNTTKQYGVIKSISTNAITLVEALDGDVNPTTGHAVAKVDKIKQSAGQIASPDEVSLKIVKTLAGGAGTIEYYILKAQIEGTLSFSYTDNTAAEPVGMPFSFEALSDAAVESGATLLIVSDV